MELDNKISTLEYLHIQIVDSSLGILDRLVCNVGKTIDKDQLNVKMTEGSKRTLY
jgi:hypothetical protein